MNAKHSKKSLVAHFQKNVLIIFQRVNYHQIVSSY